MSQDFLTVWNSKAKDVLEGRRIIEARYLNDKEVELMGWDRKPLCFFLDNGTFCILSSDDEGNSGGVLFYNGDGVLPLL